MSADFSVFIARNKMLSPVSWQEHITNSGFPLKIDTDFEPESFSGFLPCSMSNEEVGFEYYFNSLEDTSFHNIDEYIGERDICVSFSINGSPNDISAAAIAAGILAKYSDGIIWIADEFLTDIDPIEWITLLVEHIQQ